MGYKKIGYLRQVWFTIKYAIHSRLEWQKAKCWAKTCHPGWLELAQKAGHKETRVSYKAKILFKYRENNYAN
jgi:hypothetical protein